MKKSFITLILTAAALTLASCAQETGTGIDPVGGEGGNTLSLKLGFEDRPGHSVSTRVDAIVEIGEKRVQDLYLLFFDPVTTKFVDFIKIADPAGIGADNDIDMSASQLNVTAAYNILALANIASGDYLNGAQPETWLQQWAGKSETEVIQQARAWTAAATLDTENLPSNLAPVKPDALLMSGRAVKPANTFSVELTLVRNQIRFDVVNNSTLSLESVAIYNAYAASKIWNDGTDNGALDFSDDISRIRYYYGLEGSTLVSPSDNSKQMKGYFYAFENSVSMPSTNDHLTTALIVGLSEGGGTPTYYRVNIVPQGQAQMLYRNHAYSLTINSVDNPGQSTEAAAYDHPDDNGLNYVINTWDVNTIGVSDQDNNSMLSAPYKTVNIDLVSGEIAGRSERGLSANSFPITTITSLPSLPPSAQLRVVSKEFHLNGSTAAYTGIDADLSGNTLVFSPVEVLGGNNTLRSGDRVTGSIVLGYAGLRITIDVLQTDIVGDFLKVTLPDGGIPRFAPFKDIVSGMINVDASGPWSAKIMADPQGSFNFVAPAGGFDTANGNNGLFIGGAIPGATENDPGTPVWSGDEFAIRTASANTDPAKEREAFIVIRLVKDPLNYSHVIRVTQQKMSQIAIISSQTVTFDGTYDATAALGERGKLASITNNTVREFTVNPGTEDDAENNPLYWNEWTYRIEQPKVVDGKIVVVNGRIVYEVVYTEGDPDPAVSWFRVIRAPMASLAWDGEVPNPNTFKLDVTGKNTSGSVRRGRIVTYLAGTDPATQAHSDLEIVQNSSDITLLPNSVPAVEKTGGESAGVAIMADASLRWQIEEVRVAYGTRPMVNHRIEVVNAATDAVIASVDGEAVSTPAQDFPVAEGFKVRFPKIYYPNRNIPVTVTVKVGIVGTTLSKEMTFTQNALTSPGLYPYATQTTGIGNIHGGSLNTRYMTRLKLHEAARPSKTLTLNSNYMHLINYPLAATYNWAEVKTFRSQRDGLFLMDAEYNYGTYFAALNNDGSVFKDLGYTIKTSTGDDVAINQNDRAKNTKVYKMLVEGLGGATSPITGTNLTRRDIYADAHSNIVSVYPASAVPILVDTPLISGVPTNQDNEPFLVIDPKNNVIFQGESQMFDTDAGNSFVDNFIIYVKLASMWGSHFTELMVEEGQGGKPAPWDTAAWGDNAGIDLNR